MPWLHVLTLLLERRKRGWRAWAVAVAVFAASMLLRIWLDPWLDETAFLVFYPAVTVVTLVCGWQRGLTLVAASMAFVWFFIFEPRGSFTFYSWNTPISLMGFILVGSFQVAIVEALARLVLLLQRRRAVQTEIFRELQHRIAGNAYEQYAASPLSSTLPFDPVGG
jgi:two-component system, sensor histidine kinase PdtaS